MHIKAHPGESNGKEKQKEKEKREKDIVAFSPQNLCSTNVYLKFLCCWQEGHNSRWPQVVVVPTIRQTFQEDFFSCIDRKNAIMNTSGGIQGGLW